MIPFDWAVAFLSITVILAVSGVATNRWLESRPGRRWSRVPYPDEWRKRRWNS